VQVLNNYKQKMKEERGRKYRELPPINDEPLPKLPEGWIWIRLGEIIQRMQYGTSEKASSGQLGLPVVRMGNIQDGIIVFDNLKYFPENWSQQAEFLLSDGDVLFNRQTA
jgi:type I restriction enzyme S subunit